MDTILSYFVPILDCVRSLSQPSKIATQSGSIGSEHAAPCHNMGSVNIEHNLDLAQALFMTNVHKNTNNIMFLLFSPSFFWLCCFSSINLKYDRIRIKRSMLMYVDVKESGFGAHV